MKGSIITAEEIKARWAYAEVTSERFGKAYAQHLPPQLFHDAHMGKPFAAVAQTDWKLLIDVLENYARNKGFIDNIDDFGAPEYVLEEWDLSALLNCLTIPAFGEVLYPIFLARPPGTSNGVVDAADPRYKSHSIPFDPNYAPTSPLIAINFGGRYMLIEGYLRSILWLRNPVSPLQVWIPSPTVGP